MKKSVLITGTSTGLGLEAAVLFAKHGYRVFATMRNLEKSKLLRARIETEALDMELVQLDVSSTQSVEDCVHYVIEKSGTIDILINNAGGGFAKTTEQATEDEIQWVTDLNYFGVVRCTKAILPFMRKQKGGHIINISSVGGLIGQPFNELYCGTKFAVEGYTEALASYLTVAFGIKFTIVEPGGISTEFNKSAISRTMDNGQLSHPEYKHIFDRYLSGVQKRAAEGTENTYQSPLEVAQVILSAAEAEHTPLRIRTSEWAERFCELKTKADPDGTILVNAVIDRFL